MDTVAEQLQAAGIPLRLDVSGRGLSTFGAGGTVHYLVLPENASQLQTAMHLLAGVRYHVLGGGSNTLISDFGLQWVLCTRNMTGLSVAGHEITAAGGETLPSLAKFAAEHGLSGLEFACGIPGTVGGALRMNAGAYGQCMADTVVRATVATADGLREVSKQELQLRYRGSQLGGVVTSVSFACVERPVAEIQTAMRDMHAARARTQPHQPSLGCVFKAAAGVPAAKYIQGCGLKGTRIGQAALSGVHCNFIVNTAGATCRDYLRLVDVVKQAVYQRYGVNLEEEFVHIHD